MPHTVTDDNREKFDLIADQSDGVLVINDAMNIVYADKKILAFLGYDKGDLIDTPIHALLPRMVRDKHDKWVKDFKATGELKGEMATTAVAAYDKQGVTHEMRGVPSFMDGFGVVAIVNPDIRVAEVQAAVDSLKD